MTLTSRELQLLDLAAKARDRAYAPYSCFKVGAALEATNGEVLSGCNVENVSYGLTMCAERVALGAAVQKGYTAFQSLAIVTDSVEPVVPCGACRQVLAEFSPKLRILSRTLGGVTTVFQLEVLLPIPRQGILG